MAVKVCYLLVVFCSVWIQTQAAIATTDCTSDADCSADNSVCDMAADPKKCKCDDSTGFTINPSDTDACILVIGLECQSDATVCEAISNTACASACVCATNYYDSSNLCVKVLDSACTANGGECDEVDNSACTNDLCKCVAGYKDVNGACVKVLDSACTTDGNECSTVDNSECKNDLCKCEGGYMDVSAACVKVLGYDCSANAAVCDALSNTACTDDNCACATKYEESNDLCLLKDAETCTTNDECSSGKCEGETGSKTCSAQNSAQSVIFSFGLIAICVLVAFFQ